jgi:hypothetical protein
MPYRIDLGGLDAKVRDDHPAYRMTPAQRVSWFGISKECRVPDGHKDCSTYNHRSTRWGKFPCGCKCHW